MSSFSSNSPKVDVPLQSNTTNSHDDEVSWVLFAYDVIKFGVTVGLTYYVTTSTISLLKKALDPSQSEGMNALNAKKLLAKRLKRPEVETMEFSSYELKLMGDVVGADEIDVSFDDIGGLEHELDEVKDNVVLPIQIYNNMKEYGDLLPPCPTGILLYGAPGTGKTLIAKAIAKEAGATFVSIKASSILDKWFGESDRLVSALFSLGRKLSPSVIFIDEIETVLKKRDAMSSHQASSSMQGVFLAEWDGLSIDPKKADGTTASPATPNGPVVLLGATNRPNDLDPAILRRMPVKIQTRMPDEKGRLEILKAHLKTEDWSVMQINLDIIAQQTVGYSGSDIRELVRIANVQRAKEMTSLVRNLQLTTSSKGKIGEDGKRIEDSSNAVMKVSKRPLTDIDFELALIKAKTILAKTTAFNQNVARSDSENMRAVFGQMVMGSN